MKEKLVIEVNRFNRKIGLKPITEFFDGWRIHRSSHLVLFNSKDEMLIHKRALTHRLYPGLYTYAVSGFVDNESYLQSIKRETQEELGISPSFRKLFVYYFANDYDNAFHAVFSSKTDEELSIDRSEIESIKATSFDALKEDMIKHKEKYTPPFLRGMEILFSKSRFLPR